MARYTAIAAATLAALLCVALLRHDPAADADASCVHARTGSFELDVRSGADVRKAWVHMPRGALGGRLAVVLAFHGAGSDGPSMERYSGLSRLGDAERFIAVYPSAAGPTRYWTLNRSDPHKPDDVAFVTALLRKLSRTVCMDSRRVYATGVSNGGGFSARLGCELSSKIAAIAPVAGGYGALDACHPDRPVSVLEIHGDSDPVVPYTGKPPKYGGDVQRFLAMWTQLDRCPSAAQSQFVAPRIERFAWGPCADGTEVLHYRLKGVRHTWPGGDDSRDAPLRAERTVWRFFRGRTLVAR